MHLALRSALLTIAAPLLVAAIATPALAQEPVRLTGFFTLGVLSSPEYEGASDRAATPLVAARVAYGANYIETATLAGGIGLRANILTLESLEFGPVFALRRGRQNVENARVKLLNEVDDAFEAGLFLRIPFRAVLTPRDEAAIELQVLRDVSDTHGGTLLSFGASYRFRPTERLRLGLLAGATYASERYNNTYFGIDARGAAASGLPAYQPDAGIRDIGIGLTANYDLTANWGVSGLLSYRRLVSAAADSPIVRDEGNPNQLTFGLGLSYRF
ncbi:MipA/OmpV family protein [Sediminicoccus sp. KRV36]|uniref:MipA/OmpV family protein n=1 Tax=Sediminicoccus sp. KRV36 TaxID=3133721 RepID=UPI00200F5BE6|nr:MipA/OmpV family protein [Sediminicoccus rosea]UPY38863.1 MipA/OmpV family protein [Sediminicoccus rosea]